MMYKEITLSSKELVSEMFIAASSGLTELGNQLVKTAEVSDLSPEIQRSLKELQYDSDKFVYLVLAALGAGEYWGMNRNGDYFTEKGLKKNYKSYELNGYVYSHHQNKDPKKSLGRVLKAGWNDRMKRVELIVAVSKEAARERSPEFLEAVESGKFPDVSMGVKAPYDQCSICGKKATKLTEYCEHLKFQKGQILPDGRQVYAVTEEYTFFDISFVTRGADPTAKTLLKVASSEPVQEPAEKLAELRKEAPATFLGSLVRRSFTPDDIEIVHNRIPEVPEEDVLKSMLLLGRIPEEQNMRVIFHRGLLKSAEEPPPMSSILKVASALSSRKPPLTQRQVERVLRSSYGSVFKNILGFFMKHKTLSSLLIGAGLGALVSRIKGKIESSGPTKMQQMEMASMSPQEIQAYHAAKLQNTKLYGPYSVVKKAEDLEDLQLFTELLES